MSEERGVGDEEFRQEEKKEGIHADANATRHALPSPQRHSSPRNREHDRRNANAEHADHVLRVGARAKTHPGKEHARIPDSPRLLRATHYSRLFRPLGFERSVDEGGQNHHEDLRGDGKPQRQATREREEEKVLEKRNAPESELDKGEGKERVHVHRDVQNALVREGR